MRFMLIAWLSLSAYAAPRSAVLPPGKTATAAMPALGAASVRVEFRVHNRTPAHRPNTGHILQLPGGLRVSNFFGNDTTLECSSDMSALAYAYNVPADFTVRLQRDTGARKLTCEVWDSATGKRIGAATGNIPTLTSLPAGNLTLGGPYNDSRISFVRVYSTLLPLDSPQPLAFGDGGDIADYELHNDGSDSSGKNRHLSWSGGVPPTFADTPMFAPVCNPGTTQVFRAGQPMVLDGSKSYTFDESAPRLVWQNIKKPAASDLQWTSRTVVRPSIEGATFGTHDFRLMVTDSTGRQSACDVKHGVVAYDEDGAVVLPASTPAETARNKLLGKLIALGKNPWAWADDRNKALADFFGDQLMSGTSLYGPTTAYWDEPAQGTITVTYNSNVVTGVGTNFTTEFCGHNGSPSTPKPLNFLIIWYQDEQTPGRIGRDKKSVASCQSDTQLTLTSAYRRTPGTSTGLNYTNDRNRYGYWGTNSTNANFYDNVLAHYMMYYRTGLDTYLEYARTLADRWWRYPDHDEGRACPDAITELAPCNWPRNVALTGLTLRALDLEISKDPRRVDMWVGLRKWWDYYRANINRAGAPADIRENAYEFMFVAQCAIADPDPAHAAQCAASLTSSFQNKWLPARVNAPGKVMHNVWGISIFYANHAAWYDLGVPSCTPSTPCGTVTVTNGSDIVVGNGTNWQRSWVESLSFDDGKENQYFWAADDSVNGDERAYLIGGCSVSEGRNCSDNPIIDATHLRLPKPYEGPTRTTKWAISTLTGFGAQPFMLGILSSAFLTGYEATGNEAMKDAAVDIARWIATHGIQASTKALYYARGYASCIEPTPVGPLAEPQFGCSYAASNALNARFLNGEVMNALSQGYEATGDVTLRTAADTLYTAVFAKPGWASPLAGDGIWVNTWEDGGFTFSASKNKDYAFFFGIGSGARWPVSRLGDRPPPDTRDFKVSFDLNSVRTAIKVRLTLVPPTGEASASTICTSSPCAVSATDGRGDYLLKIEYLSASDSVLGNGESVPLVM
jgi:hypothetical protein